MRSVLTDGPLRDNYRERRLRLAICLSFIPLRGGEYSAPGLDGKYFDHHKSRRRKKQSRQMRQRLTNRLKELLDEYNDNFPSLQSNVASIYTIQAYAASFIWAHECVTERIEKLCFPPDSVQECWEELMNRSSRYLSQRELDMVRQRRNFSCHRLPRLPHQLHRYWEKILMSVKVGRQPSQDCVSGYSPTADIQEITKQISGKVGGNHLDGSRMFGKNGGMDDCDDKKLGNLAKVARLLKKSRIEIPSMFKESLLRKDEYGAYTKEYAQLSVGSFAVLSAIVSGACDLMKECQTDSKLDERPFPLSRSMVRWYLANLSYFQKQWLELPANSQNKNMVAKLAQFNVSPGGVKLPGWQQDTQAVPKYYIWPSLVYHARKILDYVRRRLPEYILQLQSGIDLGTLFKELDLHSCSEYDLAALMDSDPSRRIVAFHEPSTTGQTLRFAGGIIPRLDQAMVPRLSSRQVDAIPSGKLPKDYPLRYYVHEQMNVN